MVVTAIVENKEFVGELKIMAHKRFNDVRFIFDDR